MASEWAKKKAEDACWMEDERGDSCLTFYTEEIAELLDEAYEKGVREAVEAAWGRLVVDSRVYGMSPVFEMQRAVQEATGIKLFAGEQEE